MENTLGKRIAGYRKGLGLTQDQLAERLGLTAQAVSKWENDLSCPDITVLPKLADIFGVTTDTLLGHETSIPVCETTVVTEEATGSGFEFDSDTGKMDFHWDGIRLEGIGLACWVLLTGILFLAAQLIPIEATLWDILWPSFLLVFGLFGLYPRFSVFRLGCALAGGYFLADKLHLLELHLNKGIFLAVWILLFGLSLLVDVIRKQRRNRTQYKDQSGKIHHGKICNAYNIQGNCFTYDASFGESSQRVEMEKLLTGEISANFGDYTVDLSGICALEAHCRLEADCCFGSLTILVPRRYTVLPDSSTSFASFEIQGQPEPVCQGTIHLSANASFGVICIQYI